MNNRRDFLLKAAALVCAPAIVRATNLMPVRGIAVPAALQFGFAARSYVYGYLPGILKRQGEGLSAVQIAAAMNANGSGSVNGDPWDAQGVLGVVKWDQAIRRADEYIRWRRQTCGA